MKSLILCLSILISICAKPLFAGVDNGVNVKAVQKMLSELCFDVGPIDGIWGRKTEAAARDFLYNYSGQFGETEMDILKSHHWLFTQDLTCQSASKDRSDKTQIKTANFDTGIPQDYEKLINEKLKLLSKSETRELQLSLAQLGLNVGYADGVIGKLTVTAVYNFIENQNLKPLSIERVIKKVLKDGKHSRKKDVFHFYDDFSSKSLRNYELPRVPKPPNARYEPYTFVNNVSSGTSLKIKSKAKHNITNIDQNRHDDNRGRIEQDRFELTLKKGRPKSIEDKPIWIGFRIKKGDVFETHPKSHSNVFQIKQHNFGRITILAVGHGNTGSIGNKLSIMSKPNKGVREQDAKTIKEAGSAHIQPKSFQPLHLYRNRADFEQWPKKFRMHPTDLPWVASTDCEKGTVYSNFSRRYEGENVVANIGPMAPILVQNKWTTYKFGILHTRNDNGFLKVYQNDNLIYQYCGKTKETNRKDMSVDVRLGLYRTFKHGMTLDQELYYDDFTITGSKDVLDAYLGFKRQSPNKEF